LQQKQDLLNVNFLTYYSPKSAQLDYKFLIWNVALVYPKARFIIKY